jgi:hypothetical protein
MISHVMPGDAIAPMCWQTLAPVLLDALASSSDVPVAAMGIARVGDPDATRTVYIAVVLLVILGLVLAALAVWVLRRTRPEPELLAPLETMETRGWRKLDPAAQRRSLDESRPSGAAPLRREASEPAVDSSFATVAAVASFDDLSEGDDKSRRGGDSDTALLAIPDEADSTVAALEESDEASSAVIDATAKSERQTEGHADEPDDEAVRGGDSVSAERTSADDTAEITEDFEFVAEIEVDTAGEVDDVDGIDDGGEANGDDGDDDGDDDQALAVRPIDPLFASKPSSTRRSS